MRAATAMRDGGVVVAGYFDGTWNGVASQGRADFAAVKLGSAGTVIWRWQVKQCSKTTRTLFFQGYRAYAKLWTAINHAPCGLDAVLASPGVIVHICKVGTTGTVRYKYRVSSAAVHGCTNCVLTPTVVK